MIMEIERRFIAGIELRKDNGKATLHGLAVPYGKDSGDMGFVEVIAPGAFSKNLRSDPDVRALIEHDSSKIIGRTRSGTLRLTEDDDGVHVSIDPPDNQTGKDVLESVRRGDLSAMSFGFRTKNDVWGTRDGKPWRTINEAELLDVSIVAYPAYPDTSVAVRSLDQWRKENDSMSATKTEEAKTDPKSDVKETTTDKREPERRSAPIATTSHTSADMPLEWRDARTGKEIRVFDRGHKFADVYRSDEPLSLGKAVRAMIVGDWSDAQAEHRALSTTSNPTAGILVPNLLSATVIDKARALSVVARGGAQTVAMTSGSLTIARVSDDATVEIHQENTAATGSDVTFDAIELNAYTLLVLVKMSRELAADAPNAVQIIEDAMAAKLAERIDYYGLRGSGSQEPLGILNRSGLNDDAVSGSVDWDNVLTGIKELAVDNHTASSLVISPTNMDVLRKLKVNSEANHYAAPPAAAANLMMFETSNMPNTSALVADMSKAIIGLRQGVQIEVSTEAGTSFGDHSVWIKAHWRGDFGITHNEAFCTLSSIS